MPKRTSRILLRMVTMVAVLSVLAAACSGNDDPREGARGRDARSDGSPVPGAADDPDRGGGTGSDAADTTRTPLPTPGIMEDETEPPPTTTSPRGGYRYRVVNLDDDTEVGRVRVDVTTATGGDGDRRQRITTEGWELPRQTSHVSWRPDARIEERLVFVVDDKENDCDWTPDLLTHRLPLREGASWSTGVTCTTSSDGYTATTSRTENAEVTGTARVKVAGQEFAVWVIQRQRRNTIAQFGTVIENTLTEHFSPELGLEVTTTIRRRTITPSGRTHHRNYRMDLIELPR